MKNFTYLAIALFTLSTSITQFSEEKPIDLSNININPKNSNSSLSCHTGCEYKHCHHRNNYGNCADCLNHHRED